MVRVKDMRKWVYDNFDMIRSFEIRVYELTSRNVVWSLSDGDVAELYVKYKFNDKSRG